ncbi:Mediator complex subunit Med11 [Penicillium concentricum]|uniref:Mediator of RNA polymerase II transcription subunit 11 n=1 Tax=Penicillium concentricum TaxID=293559 RepID=A0A9W9V1L5_9EURO|nr:Mediator complex subunit Med11 [Penicillium concentricum]KAJ5365453.1 Mediator complex subunit Med11 [Penicillium concentricum]
MGENVPPQELPIFTSADRIRQLNDMDKDVTKLLHSAGLAIQALTNAKPDSSSVAPDGSLDSHKTRFKEASAKYFALLSSADVTLRRQIYSLEESSLVGPEKGSRAGDTKAGARNEGVAGAKSRAPNSLDISRLNTRKDTVGKDKEAELWAAARKFVEQTQKPSEKSKNFRIANEPEDMQVD